MEATTTSGLESCQTCFRPLPAESGRSGSQWTTYCRCQQKYSPKSQFSIDVCANCKGRVPTVSAVKAICAGLCSCTKPNPKKIPTYIKQNETDEVAFDIVSIGMPPDRFPAERYLPLALLGDSTRAVTLLCRDKQRGTKVAVKCFKKISIALRSTFESEVRKNKELNHTSIAKVVDFGFYQDKSPYLVTEYKDGFNLEQCLAMYGPPSHDIAVKILLGVCEALLYAQKQAVLHRDVRPGNIIFLDDMNSEPSVAVLDFALPKIKMAEELTEAYDALYMSADEARRLDYTEKSEVYALGCVGFALLTAKPPFQDGSALDIKNSHALKLPPRVSDLNFDNTRPKDLEEVVEKCLEKEPRYRFDSVLAFQERLQVFPRREQQRIAGILAARTRKKILVITGIVIAIAAVFGGGVLLLAHH